MQSATMSSMKHQGLLELTRTLLVQQTMTSLLETLTQMIQTAGIAESVTLVLFASNSERVSFYGLDSHHQGCSSACTGPVASNVSSW